jgi:hypothetical protein
VGARSVGSTTSGVPSPLSWLSGGGPVSCPADSLARGAVQRSVQPRKSRQYQRTSPQVGPPSGIICAAGNRIPHNQQDITSGGVADAEAQYSATAMLNSPPGPIPAIPIRQAGASPDMAAGPTTVPGSLARRDRQVYG